MVDARVTVAKAIFEQAHRLLEVKKRQAELVRHNLEKGLGNEEALRELLRSFLPRRFGVAKGKVVNPEGEMSCQLDVIVYDALNCPNLFIDENGNQILPIEGVYAVIEVKTTLTSSELRAAFENLRSVCLLHRRINTSTNDFLLRCPPSLQVFAYGSDRSLQAVASQYDALSNEFVTNASFSSYSPRSPGFADHTGRNFLVASVDILGSGTVMHMLDGSVEIYEHGEYTLGMFLTGVVNDFDDIDMPKISLTSYLNWIMIDQWRGTGKVQQRHRKAASKALLSSPARPAGRTSRAGTRKRS